LYNDKNEGKRKNFEIVDDIFLKQMNELKEE
jgi:hypothetical protein